MNRHDGFVIQLVEIVMSYDSVPVWTLSAEYNASIVRLFVYTRYVVIVQLLWVDSGTVSTPICSVWKL